jgi:hypothetical protein
MSFVGGRIAEERADLFGREEAEFAEMARHRL